MQAHKRPRNPKYKPKYQGVNWSEYENNLKNRGNICLWISRDVIRKWKSNSKKVRGGQQIYSDLSIEIILYLRLLFHLPLRQTEGFVESIFQLMGIDLPIPDHTTLSRRSSNLDIQIKNKPSHNKPMHLIVDSTGLSVHGSGPWSEHKHGGGKKRRGWRKLHILIDQDGFVQASEVTDESTSDGSQVPSLLEKLEQDFESLTADRGYDNKTVWKAVGDRKHVVHPRKDAVLSDKEEWTVRDYHVHRIKRDGVFQWRRESGYYQQSKVENTFSRYKTILGRKLRARTECNRQVETVIGCNILNKFLENGRHKSILVA